MELGQSSALLAAFVNLAVAVAILLRDRRRRVYVRFAIVSLNLFVFYGSSFFFRSFGSVTAQQVRFAAGVLVPAAVLSVFSSLIGMRSRMIKPLKRAVAISGFLIAALALTPYFERAWADALAATYAAVTLFMTFQLVWKKSRSSAQKADQVRLRSLAVGGAATSVLAAFEVFPSGYLPMIGNIAVSVFMYFLYQTIITYRLIDVAELISKAAVLGTLTVLLGALFELLVVWVGTGPGPFLFSTFVASFVILILYDQIKSWVEEKTIRLVFRERFVLKQTVQELLPKLRSTIDMRAVIDRALDTLYDSRKLTHASVYLVRQGELGFALASSRGPKPPLAIDAESHGAFFGEVIRQKHPLLKENFERKLVPDPDAPQSTSEAERARASEVLTTFNELGASVVLPLISGPQVLGLLSLGDARFSAGFPADELALIYQVADQIGVSIENSEEFERLRERDRLAALGEMSAGLAHEIRNPLGAIKGAAQVLEPGQLTGETRELLGIIVEEVERLNQVVSQFLAYARPMKPTLAPTDLNLVVQRTLKLFAEEKRSEKVDVKVHLEPNVPPIGSDADQLRQVLLNLLLNAVDAFEDKPGGRLELTTRIVSSPRGQNDLVELRVRDNGPGISPEDQKRVFVPFFTTKAKGTGLGLAICHRIVTSHGGRIDLLSRSGGGTTFILRFPALAHQNERAAG